MKSFIPLLTALTALGLPGCFVGVDHHHGDGIFTVDWTIDGVRHGSDCDYYGASDAYVTVESRYGTEDYDTIPCDRFGTDFDVPPGRYWVTVTLLDSHGNDVSTTITTDSYNVYADESERVVADFPPDSFR